MLQRWLSRAPEGTGPLTDVLQFNPSHFDHKGTVGLGATGSCPIQVQVILKLLLAASVLSFQPEYLGML